MKAKNYLFILFLFATNVYAQTYPFVSYGIKDGLPQVSVYDFEIDKHGNLWIATESGLSKFNGTEFKNYNTKDGLLDNFLRDIVFDDNQNLIIGTGLKGLSIFNGETFFNLYDYIKEGKEIQSLTKTSNGSILVSTEDNGLIEVSYTRPYIKQILPNSFSTKVEIAFMLSDNNYIAATHKGVLLINKGHVTIIDTTIYSDICIDSPNSYWFAGRNKLVNYKSDTIINYDFLGSNFHVRNINSDSTNLYLCTDAGFYIYHKINQNLTSYSVTEGIINNEVRSMINKKDLIIGTRGGGFTILNNRGIEFFSHYKGYKEILGVAFYSTDSALYISTYLSGFFKYTFNTKSFEKIEVSELENKYCLTLFQVLSSKNLFTTNFYTSEILEFNENNFIKKHPTPFNYIYHAASYKENEILIASSEGLYLYNIINQTFENLNPSYNQSILYFFKDDYNSIWLLCRTGEIFEYKNEKFTDYTSVFNPDKKYLYQGIYHPKYKSWIFATNEGLLISNKKQRIVLNETNSLKSNTIWSLTIDDNNHIWMGHEKGVECILYPSMKVKYFGYHQGFLPIETMSTVAVTDALGSIWIGGINSIAKFNSNVVYDEKKLNNINIEKIHINNNVIYTSTIKSDDPEKIDLNFDQNNIRVEFNCIDFVEGKELKYTYFLEGYDSDWSESSQSKKANYTNLNSGNYILHIKAHNSQGAFSNEKTITFIISKPFWQRWWFYLLEICFFVALLFLSFMFNKSKKSHRLSNIITLLTIFIVFESFLLFFSKYTDKWTYGIPVFQLIMNLVLAISLHSLENYIMKKMSNLRRKNH